MRIGVDSDGVLDNFGEGVHDALRAKGLGHLWKSGKGEPFWNFYEDWGWNFAQFKELVDWGVDYGYIFTGHWREHAIESMDRLAATGHEIVIVTDRAFGSNPMNSQRNTLEAFERAGIYYDEIIFTADKPSANVDIMVDDKTENFIALSNAGVDAYLVNRPWNKAFGPHPKRINSIADFADIVEDITRKGYTDLAFA